METASSPMNSVTSSAPQRSDGSDATEAPYGLDLARLANLGPVETICPTSGCRRRDGRSRVEVIRRACLVRGGAGDAEGDDMTSGGLMRLL